MSERMIYRDGTYLANNPDWHDEDGVWKAKQVLAMLNQQGMTPESVCDVGCGTGRVLDEMSRHLPSRTRLHGYDIAMEAISVGKARGNERVGLHAEDALAAGQTYDVVLMMDVFEHVPDYLGFLQARNALGKHFVFHIPLDMNVSAVLRMKPLLQGRRGLGHLHYFSRETALATLADAGYVVQAEAYTPGGLELPARTLKRRLAKLPRRLGSAVQPHLTARLLGGFSLLVLATGGAVPCQTDAADSHA